MRYINSRFTYLLSYFTYSLPEESVGSIPTPSPLEFSPSGHAGFDLFDRSTHFIAHQNNQSKSGCSIS